MRQRRKDKRQIAETALNNANKQLHNLPLQWQWHSRKDLIASEQEHTAERSNFRNNWSCEQQACYQQHCEQQVAVQQQKSETQLTPQQQQATE